MGNPSQNLRLSLISPITLGDRTNDGNLLPESRERILCQIEEFFAKSGHVNIQQVANKLEVSWQTAHDLVDEAVERLRSIQNSKNTFVIQIAWIEDLLEEVHRNREKYGIKDEWELVAYKLALLRELDRLSYALDPQKQKWAKNPFEGGPFNSNVFDLAPKLFKPRHKKRRFLL